jgi:hypothetical protein
MNSPGRLGLQEKILCYAILTIFLQVPWNKHWGCSATKVLKLLPRQYFRKTWDNTNGSTCSRSHRSNCITQRSMNLHNDNVTLAMKFLNMQEKHSKIHKWGTELSNLQMRKSHSLSCLLAGRRKHQKSCQQNMWVMLSWPRNRQVLCLVHEKTDKHKKEYFQQ